MSFFDRDGGEDDSGADDGQHDSLARLRAGGIPLEAEARLRGLSTDGSLFTSGLSVAEFALLGTQQVRPLAQVMGASVVQVAPQLLPSLPPRIVRRDGRKRREEPSRWQRLQYGWESSIVCELGQLAHAWNLARRRAFRRLRDEAVAVGADLVVGVRLQRATLDHGGRTIDLVVSGTAVRRPVPRGEGQPVLTDLSAQEFWRLHELGFEPTGLMLATSVVFASPANGTRWQRARSPRQNWEIDELSRGFQDARERVRAQLREAVAASGGEGLVGVELSHEVSDGEFEHWPTLQQGRSRGWQRGTFGLPYYFSGGGEGSRRGHVITMHGAGTALRRARDPSLRSPRLAVGMGSG